MRHDLVVLAFLVAACATDERPVGGPDVVVEGAEVAAAGLWLVDLGTVPLAERAERTITLRNRGDASTFLTLAPPEAPFDVELPRRELGAGESLQLSVSFMPVAAGRRETVASIALDGGSIDLRLRGVGISAAADCLAATPPTLTFDDTGLGCPPAHAALEIENRCEVAAGVDLKISPGDGSFVFARRPDLPVLLGAGARLELELAFQPTATGEQQGRLVVDTGNGPALQVELQGRTSAVPRVEKTDVFGPWERLPVDLLFVIDGSEAMEPWRARLAEVAAAVEAVSWNPFDLRIAATTASLDEVAGCGGEGGGLLPVGAPEVLTHETPDLAVRVAALLDVGTCVPAGAGRPLEAALQAADSFFREDARMHLVIIAAEEDRGLLPTDELVLRMLETFGRQPFGVSVVHPAADCGIAEEGTRLVAFAEALWGTTVPICNAEWALDLPEVFVYPPQYPLTEWPLDMDGDGLVTAADLVVSVDDAVVEPVHEGNTTWLWDSKTNRIEFNPFFAQGWDSTVAVRYEAADLQACADPSP